MKEAVEENLSDLMKVELIDFVGRRYYEWVKDVPIIARGVDLALSFRYDEVSA